MGKIRWYKRHPDAALQGMMELSLEERGAYNTVLDLIYSNDGSVVDDDKFIAGWLRVDVRVWKRIKSRLIELKKLYVDNNTLRNHRADREVDEALHRGLSARQAALSKHAKSSRESSHNNDIASATAHAVALPLKNLEERKTLSTESSIGSESVSGNNEQIFNKARPKKSRAACSNVIDLPLPEDPTQEWLLFYLSAREWQLMEEHCPRWCPAEQYHRHMRDTQRWMVTELKRKPPRNAFQRKALFLEFLKCMKTKRLTAAGFDKATIARLKAERAE